MAYTIGRLCVITDPTLGRGRPHSDIVERAIEGGADMIQFRDKLLRDPERTDAAKELQIVCHVAGAPLIINDHIDVAVTVDAAGVHVGQTDASIAEARAALGEDRIVGASTGNVAQARAAEAAGADYIGFGHIYPTGSKDKPTPPVGLVALAEVCRAVTIPVLAIGGINLDNVSEVIAAGAWGVAVIGAVTGAEDPREAAALMKARIEVALERRSS